MRQERRKSVRFGRNKRRMTWKGETIEKMGPHGGSQWIWTRMRKVRGDPGMHCGAEFLTLASLR